MPQLLQPCAAAALRLCAAAAAAALRTRLLYPCTATWGAEGLTLRTAGVRDCLHHHRPLRDLLLCVELFPRVPAILLHSDAERPCAQVLMAALLDQLLQPSGCADGKGTGFQHHAIPGCRVCCRIGADVIPNGPHV